MSLSESLPEPSNPIGIDGIEFIEYATAQPQAFGALLQKMGFAAVARHRSREVMLYREGTMNLIVNSHAITDPTPQPAIAGSSGQAPGSVPAFASQLQPMNAAAVGMAS